VEGVWYSWTAPESGEASIGYGAGGPGLLAVYTGTALGELTEVASSSSQPAGIHIPVVGGTRYMIAVDGKRSETSGEPQLGAFALTVFEQLAPGPGHPDAAGVPVPGLRHLQPLRPLRGADPAPAADGQAGHLAGAEAQGPQGAPRASARPCPAAAPAPGGAPPRSPRRTSQLTDRTRLLGAL
jgi:hypothetical protein